MQKDLDGIDADEKARKKDLEEIAKKITTLKAQMNSPPTAPESQETIDADQERIRQEGAVVREAQHEITEAIRRLTIEEQRAQIAAGTAENQYVTCLVNTRLGE